MWFMEKPSQFSMGQTVQSLTCFIMEKPHTGLDDCLNMLLAPSLYYVSVQNPKHCLTCSFLHPLLISMTKRSTPQFQTAYPSSWCASITPRLPNAFAFSPSPRSSSGCPTSPTWLPRTRTLGTCGRVHDKLFQTMQGLTWEAPLRGHLWLTD